MAIAVIGIKLKNFKVVLLIRNPYRRGMLEIIEKKTPLLKQRGTPKP